MINRGFAPLPLTLTKIIEMKKIICIALLFIPLSVLSQKEGTIVYSETVKMDFKAPEGMEEMFKDIPRSRTSTKSLQFKSNISLYKNLDNEDMEMEKRFESEGGESVIKFKMHEPDNQVFSNFESKFSITEQNRHIYSKES